MNYIICCVVSFFVGCITSYLFQRYISIEIKIKKAIIKPKVFRDPRLQKIQIMLEEIKRCGTIPVKLPKAAEKSLMVIAQTKDWENKIDEQTLNTLNRIYNTWQMHVESEKKCKMSKGAQVTVGGGFEKKYWEGTEEEYEEALKNGEIDENTTCRIYKLGDSYTLNENGSWEEEE